MDGDSAMDVVGGKLGWPGSGHSNRLPYSARSLWASTIRRPTSSAIWNSELLDLQRSTPEDQ